jgi:hypothetical protein
MVVVHVELMTGLNEHDAGAEALGLTHLGSGANAVLLGLITGCDTASCISHERYDSQGAVA